MSQDLILLRNSERSTYRRCRQKWQWSYVEGRAPKSTKPALRFGTLVHKALEAWYVPGTERGDHPATAFEELYEEEVAIDGSFRQWDDEGEKVESLELGVAMLKGYVDTYGSEPELEILFPEMRFAIDITDEHGEYIVTLVGTIDGVYRHVKTKRIGLLEHKTAKAIPSVLRMNSGYGEQGLVYWWAATLWLRHQELLPPDGIIDVLDFNWLRKGLPSDKPRNELGHVLNKPSKEAIANLAMHVGTKSTGTIAAMTEGLLKAGVSERTIELLGEPSARQPSPLFRRDRFDLRHENLSMLSQRIVMEAKEMRMVREGQLDVFKNPSKDCDWDCPFVEVCELHEMGQAYHQDMLDLEFVDWDPYDEHALLEEGNL